MSAAAFTGGMAAGIVLLGTAQALMQAVAPALPTNRLEGLQWRVQAGFLRRIGFSKLYDSRIRALRVIHQAAVCARLVGVDQWQVETTAVLGYRETAEQDVRAAYGKLGTTVLMAAHVQSIRLGDELLRQAEVSE